MMLDDLTDLRGPGPAHPRRSISRQMRKIGGFHRCNGLVRQIDSSDILRRPFLYHAQALVIFGCQEHQGRAAMTGDNDRFASRKIGELSQPF
jgi:hypothetical protein